MRIKFGLSLLLVSLLLGPGCLFHKKSKPPAKVTPIDHPGNAPAPMNEVYWDGTTNSKAMTALEPDIKMELVTNLDELLKPAPATNVEPVVNAAPKTITVTVVTNPEPVAILEPAPTVAPVTNVEVMPNPPQATTVEVMPNVEAPPVAEPITNLVSATPPEAAVVAKAETNTVQPPGAVERPNAKMIVTPDKLFTATVTFVNSAAKFVVLTFPIGHLPAENATMNVYRRGLKVGEVKITGPQKDDNVVADLVNGDAQLGDDVR